VAKTASKVQLWNRALDRIGETDAIETETEDRLAAGICNRHHDDCLLQVFESSPWPFATKQASLSSPTGVTRTGWEYIYTLPTDCAVPLALLDEDQRIAQFNSDERIPFEILADDDDDWRILCCDVASDEFEVLEYTALHESIESWPRAFVDAFVWRMAAELALALKKDRALYVACMQSFAMAVSAARADQFNARHPDPEPDPPSVAARS